MSRLSLSRLSLSPRHLAASVLAAVVLATAAPTAPSARADSDRAHSDRGDSDRAHSDRGDSDRGDSDRGDSDRWPARIELPTGWRPEGITAGRGTSLYVGSLADGAIWKADARTGQGGVLSPGAPGRVSVGVEFDKRSNRLWVAGGGTSEIRAVDAATGAILQTYAVPGGAGFLNDLVVTRDAVYVTDSMRSQLIVIPTARNGALPPASAVSVLALSGGASGNGIVEIDGRLVIVQSATGLLFRVDPATGEATAIDLGGYLVTNGDGLELGKGRDLYVVRNRSNIVAEIDLRRDLASGRLVREITDPGLDVPSTIALQAGRLWAVNARFGVNPTATASYWITQLPAR